MTQLQGLHPHTREFSLPWWTISRLERQQQLRPCLLPQACLQRVMGWNRGWRWVFCLIYPLMAPPCWEQLRSQGGQPGGVPLGSPSKKDCGFSCKDRCELTLQRPVPLRLSLAFELKAHFSRKPQQGLTQREDYGLALTAQAGLLYQAVSSGAPRQLVRPAHSLPKNGAAFSFSGCWCNGSSGLIQVPTPSFSGVLPSNNPPSFPILFKGLHLRGQS